MTRVCDSAFHPLDPMNKLTPFWSSGYCAVCHDRAVSLYSACVDQAGLRHVVYSRFMWSVMYDYQRAEAK